MTKRRTLIVGGQGDNGLFNESPADMALRDAIVMQRSMQRAMEAGTNHTSISSPVAASSPTTSSVPSSSIEVTPIAMTPTPIAMTLPVNAAPMASVYPAAFSGGGRKVVFKPSSSKKGAVVLYDNDVDKINAIKNTTPFWKKAGYTILWVTHRVVKGVKTETASWIKSITYRQFNTMLTKKTSMYTELQKKNGPEVFNKTLIIIDDVIQLFASKAYCIFAELVGKSTGRIIMFASIDMALDHRAVKILDLLKPYHECSADIDALMKGNLTQGGKKLIQRLASHVNKA